MTWNDPVDRNLLKLDVFALLAFIGLDWPFWPLMAFNDFFRPREVFMGINQVKMTTYHPSDIKNGHHTRFTKAVHSDVPKGFPIEDISVIANPSNQLCPQNTKSKLFEENKKGTSQEKLD